MNVKDIKKNLLDVVSPLCISMGIKCIHSVSFYKNDFYKKQGWDSADLPNKIKNTLLKIWGWADLGCSYKNITSVSHVKKCCHTCGFSPTECIKAQYNILKNWQHHLWVNFSSVLDTKQKQAASQQNQKGGRFWISQSDNSKTIITLVKDKHHIKGVIIILLILAIKS